MSGGWKYEEGTLTRSEWERYRNENAKKLRKGNVIVTESSPRKRFQ
jgi:hypothetical protein